jgi:hypothetical protein
MYDLPCERSPKLMRIDARGSCESLVAGQRERDDMWMKLMSLLCFERSAVEVAAERSTRLPPRLQLQESQKCTIFICKSMRDIKAGSTDWEKRYEVGSKARRGHALLIKASLVDGGRARWQR